MDWAAFSFPSDHGTSGLVASAPVVAPVGRGETRRALNVRVILPGVKRDDLRLDVSPGCLRVGFERHPPAEFAEPGREILAIPYGRFSQDVRLPEGLDLERFESHLHDGVLDVHIPWSDKLVAAAVAARPTLPDAGAEVLVPVAV